MGGGGGGGGVQGECERRYEVFVGAGVRVNVNEDLKVL